VGPIEVWSGVEERTKLVVLAASGGNEEGRD